MQENEKPINLCRVTNTLMIKKERKCIANSLDNGSEA